MKLKDNPRLTKKDINLIKAALRRAFSRSDLRNQVINDAVIRHADPTRPKVKTWCKCNICGQPEAKSYCVVDHIDPFVKIGEQFEDQPLHVSVNRLWCVKDNLQCLDTGCHDKKSAEEREKRRAIKNERQKSERSKKTSKKRS